MNNMLDDNVIERKRVPRWVFWLGFVITIFSSISILKYFFGTYIDVQISNTIIHIIPLSVYCLFGGLTILLYYYVSR